jgi:hypothetical protein
MANLYVRSTDGNDADNGTTWALSKATIAGAAAIDSTTDRTIMVSDNHAETPSGSTSWSWAGTKAAPTIVRCVDDSAEPPTATAATATVVCDNVLSVSAAAAYVHFDGIAFTAGSGGSTTLSFVCGVGGYQAFNNCNIALASTGASSSILLKNTTVGFLEWNNVNVKFAAAGQQIGSGVAAFFVWNGGGLLSGGTSPTALFSSTLSGNSTIFATGIDLTNASASINICATTTSGVTFVARDWKLPDSWSGAFHSGTPGVGSRFSFYNCDSTDTQNRLAIHTHYGTIVSETTIIRTGKDLSWKFVSNADAEWPHGLLDSDEIVFPITSVGSSKTIKLYTVTDNVTLTDQDIEAQVLYLGTSGRPLGSFSSTAPSNTLATASNLTTNSETWTTTGLTTPVKQELSVSFTPQEVGFAHVKVNVRRASTTVYVCPDGTVT